MSNLHWKYTLINKIGQWFYQLDHVTFSKNIFCSVNPFTIFIMSKYAKVDISMKKAAHQKVFLGKVTQPH